jgi:hypothetical protein
MAERASLSLSTEVLSGNVLRLPFKPLRLVDVFSAREVGDGMQDVPLTCVFGGWPVAVLQAK